MLQIQSRPQGRTRQEFQLHATAHTVQNSKPPPLICKCFEYRPAKTLSLSIQPQPRTQASSPNQSGDDGGGGLDGYLTDEVARGRCRERIHRWRTGVYLVVVRSFSFLLSLFGQYIKRGWGMVNPQQQQLEAEKAIQPIRKISTGKKFKFSSRVTPLQTTGLART